MYRLSVFDAGFFAIGLIHHLFKRQRTINKNGFAIDMGNTMPLVVKDSIVAFGIRTGRKREI